MLRLLFDTQWERFLEMCSGHSCDEISINTLKWLLEKTRQKLNSTLMFEQSYESLEMWRWVEFNFGFPLYRRSF